MTARLCTVTSCPNEATECYCGSGAPDVCEQHPCDLDVSHKREEFEIARDYVAGFAKVAGASDCCRLMGLMDQARTQREMRLSIIEAERGMVRE